SGLRGGQFGARLRQLALQLLVLALGPEGVAEEVEQVTERLGRRARALLDRREDGLRPALDLVQHAAARLAEVRSEEDHRERDENGQDGSPPPDDLLVVQGSGSSSRGQDGARLGNVSTCGGFGSEFSTSGGSARTTT